MICCGAKFLAIYKSFKSCFSLCPRRLKIRSILKIGKIPKAFEIFSRSSLDEPNLLYLTTFLKFHHQNFESRNLKINYTFKHRKLIWINMIWIAFA